MLSLPSKSIRSLMSRLYDAYPAYMDWSTVEDELLGNLDGSRNGAPESSEFYIFGVPELLPDHALIEDWLSVQANKDGAFLFVRTHQLDIHYSNYRETKSYSKQIRYDWRYNEID